MLNEKEENASEYFIKLSNPNYVSKKFQKGVSNLSVGGEKIKKYY